MLHSPRSATATTALALALLAAIGFSPAAAASVGGGNISIGWSIPNVPAAGLTDITFPITIGPRTLHQSGTYFAQQFGFTHSGGAYMGLQPRPNLNGRERLHAAFSSFIAGTTSTDPQCHDGADGGAGTSCAVDFDGVYGHEYDLTVANSGPDTWTGTVVDAVTGRSTHIGTWTLGGGSGNLTGYYGGFVEYYLGIPSCDRMPYIDVTFGAPTSTDAGGLTGTSKPDNEYGGVCLGHAGFSGSTVGRGAHVVRGFIAESPSGQPTTVQPPSPPANSATTPRPTASPPTSASATASGPQTPTPSALGAPATSPTPTAGSGLPQQPGSSPDSTSSPGSAAALGVSALGLVVAAGAAFMMRRGRRATGPVHRSPRR